MDRSFRRMNTYSVPTMFFADTPCQLSVNNSHHVLKILRDLYEQKKLCDVYLTVGAKVFGAHKLILSAASEVFQVMLMKEEWNEDKNSQMNLIETSECQKVFPLFLQYFYTGELVISHTNVLPILSLADKYMVKSLAKVCLQYMYDHISHASTHNQLFSWMQYFQVCGHKEMAGVCEEFIKSNFESVCCSEDLVNLDQVNMVRILKQDDIVVQNEVKVFECVVRWLELQQVKLEKENEKLMESGEELKNSEEILEFIKYLILLVMHHVRFPMLKVSDIKNLMRFILVRENPDYFLDRIGLSLEFNLGDKNKIKDLWFEENQQHLQPRLYTSPNYSYIFIVEDFVNLPKYKEVSYTFETDCSFNSLKQNPNTNMWKASLYPKGVLYDPCYLIEWQNRIEVPQKVLPIVRLKILCTRLFKPDKFKFSILVYGVRGQVEHILRVKSEIHSILESNTSIIIENVIPFSLLNTSDEETHSEFDKSYLTGKFERDLKLQIIIIPVL